MFEQREEVVKTVKWRGEGHVEFEFEDGVCWMGSKRKDYWNPESDWEGLIKPGTRVRTWTIQWCTVLGFEIWGFSEKRERMCWIPVWAVTNDFQTKADRKKSEEAYSGFIEKEGRKIARLIDKGKNLSEINELISKDHSGNTHACALHIGVTTAKNKENADKIRKEHNKEWGVEGSTGLVNPAVVTLVTK